MTPEQIALLKAAKELRDDLLMRGDIEDGVTIVACGCGVWSRFNEAISKAEEASND